MDTGAAGAFACGRQILLVTAAITDRRLDIDGNTHVHVLIPITPAFRRLPCEIQSPTRVWLAYEQTEHFLRKIATHFPTSENGVCTGVILALEHGRVAAAAHIG